MFRKVRVYYVVKMFRGKMQKQILKAIMSSIVLLAGIVEQKLEARLPDKNAFCSQNIGENIDLF